MTVDGSVNAPGERISPLCAVAASNKVERNEIETKDLMEFIDGRG